MAAGFSERTRAWKRFSAERRTGDSPFRRARGDGLRQRTLETSNQRKSGVNTFIRWRSPRRRKGLEGLRGGCLEGSEPKGSVYEFPPTRTEHLLSPRVRR